MPKTPDFKQNKSFTDLIGKQVRPLPETGWNYVSDPEAEHGVDFQNGANVGASSVPASWYLSEDGEVRIRGHVADVNTGDIIFTLPEEVRPEFTETYIIPAEDDGSIHLENIHFRAFEEGDVS